MSYPVKPPQISISEYLSSSPRVRNWFRRNRSKPTITRFAFQQANLTEKPEHPQPENSLPQLSTISDLAQWLSLTITELDWFTDRWRREASTPEQLNHYRYDFRQKRQGGLRLIEKPKVRLKQIQRKIYEDILCTQTTHPAAHGFTKGRNCLSHASIHAGKRYVMSYDIAECFHSINWPSVKAVFTRLGYTQEVASYLTHLCTHSAQLNHQTLRQFDRAQKERLKQRHLPQGAPTSPSLANAVLHQLDLRLSGLAKSLDADYSRYADDIAMSSNSVRDWRFLEPLIGSICLEEGVALNYKKTRIKREHQKQRLVGIVVNKKPNIDREYFDALKAILTNCRRHGIESQNRNGHPHFRAHLLGRIQYVKSLNSQRGTKLESIYYEINA